MVCKGAGNPCVQSLTVFYFTQIFKVPLLPVPLEDLSCVPQKLGGFLLKFPR